MAIYFVATVSTFWDEKPKVKIEKKVTAQLVPNNPHKLRFKKPSHL